MKRTTLLPFIFCWCSLSVYGQEALDSLRTILNESNQDTTLVGTLSKIGDVFYYEGQADSAIYYWEKGKEKADKILQKELTLEIKLTTQRLNAILYNDLAYLYVGKGNYDKALGYFRNSIRYRELLKDTSGILQGYSNIGYLYIQKGQTDSALFYNKRVLDLAQRYKLKEQEGISYMQVAVLYTKIGLIEEALEHLKNAQKIFTKINNPKAEAIVLNNIAKVYVDMEEYNTALEYFFKSLELKYTDNDMLSIANTYNNIGAAYQRVEELSLAKKYDFLALEFFDKAKNTRGKATVLNNIGNLYVDLDQTDSAMILFQQSLALRQEIHDKSGIAYSLFNIAKIEHRNHQLEQAVNHLKKAYTLADETTDYNLLQKIAKELYTIYKVEKKYEEALYYHEQLLRFKELILNQKNLESLNRLKWQKSISEFQPKVKPVIKKDEKTNTIPTKVILIVLGVLGLLVVFLVRKR